MFDRIYNAATGEYTDVTLTPQEIAARTPTLENAKAVKLAALADRRWRAETGGMVWGEYWIATDDKSQAKIAAERLAAENGTRREGDLWKCGDMTTGQAVFVSFADAEIISLSDAARNHVSDTFNVEGAFAAAILSAADLATLDAIDIESGW